MKIYLARHTETNYNVKGLCNSDPNIDVHLTARGLQQAQELSSKLQNATWDVVYISELPRTRQTAEIVNDGRDTDLVVDKRLNDNRTGFEDKPITDFFAALDASSDRFNASFNGGESYNEVAKRVNNFLDELKTKPYKSVLVVAHGLITAAIMTYVEHKPISSADQLSIPQGSFLELKI